jgi:hypothetical protein
MKISSVCVAALLAVAAAPAVAQVDQERAAAWFREAALLCEREGGKLWGMSLCGPMVIADPVTRTMATNQPRPDVPPPPAVGFANAAMDWGGTRWSTFVWQHMPAADSTMRRRLMIHELFHRIQPDLGFRIQEGENDHLDTPDGRYWIQLEWRALARALETSAAERERAVRDALGFRAARRRQFPEAALNEQRLEFNEGLAQYTGTVVAAGGWAEAAADAVAQLGQAPVLNETLVRTFPYPSGAAYGLLLDVWAPGWTRRIKMADDFGDLLAAASGLRPTADAAAAAAGYGGPELRVAEQRRAAERERLVAELRAVFVDGPVIVVPNGRSNSFVTNGITPLPGAGTVYPSFRTTGAWGRLAAERALWSTDRATVIVPAPTSVAGDSLAGPGWTATLAPGWIIRPGRRSGDFEVVRAEDVRR